MRGAPLPAGSVGANFDHRDASTIASDHGATVGHGRYTRLHLADAERADIALPAATPSAFT
jgi:hypothetical protein